MRDIQGLVAHIGNKVEANLIPPSSLSPTDPLVPNQQYVPGSNPGTNPTGLLLNKNKLTAVLCLPRLSSTKLNSA